MGHSVESPCTAKTPPSSEKSAAHKSYKCRRTADPPCPGSRQIQCRREIPISPRLCAPTAERRDSRGMSVASRSCSISESRLRTEYECNPRALGPGLRSRESIRRQALSGAQCQSFQLLVVVREVPGYLALRAQLGSSDCASGLGRPRLGLPGSPRERAEEARGMGRIRLFSQQPSFFSSGRQKMPSVVIDAVSLVWSVLPSIGRPGNCSSAPPEARSLLRTHGEADPLWQR